MKQKIVFLDIDGTLVTKDEQIPASAVFACRTARENGHLIFLCTGRSKPEIYDFIWEIGFDGIIGAGGGFVELDSEILYQKTVPEESLDHLKSFFAAHHIDYYLENNSGIFYSQNLIENLERLIYGDPCSEAAIQKKQRTPHPIFQIFTSPVEDPACRRINKICFLDNRTTPFSKIQKEFENSFSVIRCTVPVFGENSGELMVPGIHKAKGIDVLLKHIGKEITDTIAIGDGLNDLEMIAYCHTGIAMGNGAKELKQAADHVTASVEEDGIYKSFKKYGLLG